MSGPASAVAPALATAKATKIPAAAAALMPLPPRIEIW
jgi:hypothetical protein